MRASAQARAQLQEHREGEKREKERAKKKKKRQRKVFRFDRNHFFLSVFSYLSLLSFFPSNYPSKRAMHGRPRAIPGAPVDPEKAKAAAQRVREKMEKEAAASIPQAVEVEDNEESHTAVEEEEDDEVVDLD